MKIDGSNHKNIHHKRLAAFGFLVTILLTACNSREFVEDANQFINPMPSIPSTNATQQNQNAQRRPFPTPFPTVEIPPTPTPTPEPDDGLDLPVLGIEDLESAFIGALYADALSVSIANENLTNGERYSLMYEFIRPDKFHLVTADSEIVVSDGYTYRRQPGTNWMISPGQAMELFEGILDPYLEEEVAKTQIDDLLSTTTDVRVEGQRIIDGTEYYVLTFTEIQPGEAPPGKTTVWVGVRDGLLYRQINLFVENGQEFRTTITYAYGADVEITRPYP